MEIGQILIGLLVLAYTILYIRGRVYKREAYTNMGSNDSRRVDVIGSRR
jgi:hypothetical protein